MPFTARIDTIKTTGETISVGVTYADSATGWSTEKQFEFPESITQGQAVTAITAAGQAFKAALAKNVTLQAAVGTVLTI